MKRVLFLCSGNYYRSRFAEHLFNHIAEERGLPWRAESRGLSVDRSANVGPISRDTLEALRVRGVAVSVNPRDPIQTKISDLSDSDLVIALKEAEHRAMMDERFPRWADQVEYWHVDDLDCAGPEEALPAIEQLIRTLVDRLQAAETKTAA